MNESNTAMKLSEYYAYLEIRNPLTCWEVSIGRIITPENNDPNCIGMSLWGYQRVFNLLKNSQLNSYYLLRECQLEWVRKNFFPNKCSRLYGAFFFKTLEDAHIGIDRWSKSVQLHEQVCKVNFMSDREPTIVDSNYITYCLKEYGFKWMFDYWSGKAYPKASPLWEVITTGIGHIDINQQTDLLRQSAYNRMIKRFPRCNLIHQICKIGFSLGFDTIGRVAPFIQKVPNSPIIRGRLLFDSRLLKDAHFIHTLKYGLKRHKLPPLPNDGTLGSLPNFSDYFFEINLDKMDQSIQKLFDYNSK